MQKSVVGNTQFSLQAAADESLLVRDIFVSGPSGTHATINVDRGAVGYFRVSGALGNHIGFVLQNAANEFSPYYTVLGYLNTQGLFDGFPIQTGQTMTIDGVHQAASEVVVVYDRYDAGDIRQDMPNGPAANEFIYINYGNSGAAFSTGGDHELSTAVNPSEFPDFPFGKAVPGRTTVELHGVLASTFAPVQNDGTDAIYTQYLKFTRNREVLFDKDKNGLLMIDATTNVSTDDQVGEGQSTIGNYSDVDYKRPLMFDPPLIFEAGEELTVDLNTAITNSGQSMATADQEIGLILKVIRS